MAERELHEPWEDIRAFVCEGRLDDLHALLEVLSPGEVARMLSRLDTGTRHRLLTLLSPETAADLIEELVDAQGADIIEDLPVNHAAAIIDEMDSDRRADLLSELDEENAEAILTRMDPEEAEDARKLLEFEEDTAGGIMVTEFISYPEDTKVSEVVKDMRDNAETYSDYGVQYAYVTSGHNTLIGVLRLRDLLLSPPDKMLRDIMIANPVYVLADTPIDELNRFFDRYPFWSLPVTGENGVILGAVRRADMEEALGEEQEKALLRFGGIIGGEELRSMPIRERAVRRLVWLSLNMALSILAASVILMFEGTIAQVFALVFFIPIIANMSGCSGNQAVAMSIRELALGLVQPGDVFRVWGKELAVGAINGMLLGGILGTVALILNSSFWHGFPYLPLVAGGPS